jgi:hypothetical protein
MLNTNASSVEDCLRIRSGKIRSQTEVLDTLACRHTDAGADRYRRAAKRLAGMRKLAPAPDSAAGVDALISELREEHKRPPRLQQEFTRAGLP